MNRNLPSMPSRILLSDDDSVLLAGLAEQLAHEGLHEVVCASSAEQALEAGQGLPFALAIIGQAGASGRELAARLRDGGMACPILLLAEDAGQDGGGFEVLAKPFRFSALLARIHALITHHAADGDAAVRIGPYTFHPSAKLLQADGRKVRLTEKETNILKFLHASAGAVSREILLHEVWGYGPAVATHTLETHIYRLRKKIEEDPGRAQILLTEGGGYRLSA
jgi:DNA-binding response OmpR family regulator